MDRIELADGTLLRRPTTGDVPGILAVHGDPRVYTLDPLERHPDANYTARWLETFLHDWERHGFGYWVVLVPAAWHQDGVPGSCDGDGPRVLAGMGGIRWHTCGGQDVLNVYFRLAPEVHGRRLAGRMVDLGLQWAAEHLPEVDLVVRTRPANDAAKRVAERAGFVAEGDDPDEAGLSLLRRRAVASES